jgi:ABC-2 type transport system ATP-binding protein
LIRISSLSKRYSGAALPALDGVDLCVPRGCIYGLLGANGAGKTTLLSILLGLTRKDAGTVIVDDIDLDRDPRGLRRLIGYVPQALAFHPNLTVSENLRLYAALTPGAPANAVGFSIESTQLQHHLDKRAHALSGGLQRRLNLAIGLLGAPRLLCLDEPTAGVDPQTRHFLLGVIGGLRDAGVTVLLTSHHIDEMERACDRVALLVDGRLHAEGRIADLLGAGESLEAWFLSETASTDLPA